MTQKHDSAKVVEVVGEWFSAHARDLPWRRPGTSAWGVLVSEVMSQQTQVERVAPIWLQWMGRWPTPKDLADSTPGEVIKAWGRLGYPRRALRLHQSATLIAREHQNQVPTTYAELIELPGIGEYTANAVLAFAYRERVAVLDTNVRRVIARVFHGARAHPGHLSVLERDFATRLVPNNPEAAAHWAESVMEFGALVCQAKAPSCETCPLQKQCKFYNAPQPSDIKKEVRKTQRWEGSNRQVRGMIMSVLRASREPLSKESIFQQANLSGNQQDEHCLHTLVTDGLAQCQGKKYGLPQ